MSNLTREHTPLNKKTIVFFNAINNRNVNDFVPGVARLRESAQFISDLATLYAKT